MTKDPGRQGIGKPAGKGRAKATCTPDATGLLYMLRLFNYNTVDTP